MAVFTVDEKTNSTYTFTILDESGNPVQPTALTLTYCNRTSSAIINSRDGQDVLNMNNVTVVNGVVTWSIQVADTTIIDVDDPADINVALWTWTANSKVNRHETIIRVINLAKVI